MVTKEQIERINQLARKSKSEGLTEEEREEQQALRRVYIDSFKANLKAQLENITFVDEVHEKGKKEEVGKEKEEFGEGEHNILKN